MGNHNHLIIETPSANLVAGMAGLQSPYTRRFDSRHGPWGRLFGDRYKLVLIESGRPDERAATHNCSPFSTPSTLIQFEPGWC